MWNHGVCVCLPDPLPSQALFRKAAALTIAHRLLHLLLIKKDDQLQSKPNLITSLKQCRMVINSKWQHYYSTNAVQSCGNTEIPGM